MSNPKICPSCKKKEYEPGDKYCEWCGNALPAFGVNEKVWVAKRAQRRSPAGVITAIYVVTLTVIIAVGAFAVTRWMNWSSQPWNMAKTSSVSEAVSLPKEQEQGQEQGQEFMTEQTEPDVYQESVSEKYTVVKCEDDIRYTYLRSECSADSETLLKLRKHNVVDVTDSREENGEIWAYASYYGCSGWVNMKYLHQVELNSFPPGSRNQENVYVCVDRVNLRADRSEESQSYDKIPYGSMLLTENYMDGWIEVTWNGQHGFVYSPCVAEYLIGNYCVNTDAEYGMYYRSTPSGESDNNRIGTIANGTILTVESVEDGWGKVNYDSVYGWVQMSYLYPV